MTHFTDDQIAALAQAAGWNYRELEAPNRHALVGKLRTFMHRAELCARNPFQSISDSTWISVEEQLPPPNISSCVLVLRSTGSDLQHIADFAEYRDGQWLASGQPFADRIHFWKAVPAEAL